MGSAVTAGAVGFDELPGSPRFGSSAESQSGGGGGGGGRSSLKASRTGIIDWDDINALIAECTPPAPTLPGGFPGFSNLYVKSVAIKPFLDEVPDCSGDVAAYDHAEATIEYESLPYDVSTLVSRRYSVSAEFMTIPSGTLYWEDDGTEVTNEDVSAAKIIPLIEHSITWHRVTSVPFATIQDLIGKVNDDTALDNDYFPDALLEQSLLFIGAEINFTFSSDGTKVWTIEYRFQEKRIKNDVNVYGFNHFLNPKTSLWDRLVDIAGDPIYPTSPDFDDLFA